VDLSSLNVIWSDYAHAAPKTGLVEVRRILVLLIQDEELRHDRVNVNVEWVVWAPVMVQNLKRLRKLLLRLLKFTRHVVCLHEDGLELDGGGVLTLLPIFQLLFRLDRHLLGRLPLSLFKL